LHHDLRCSYAPSSSQSYIYSSADARRSWYYYHAGERLSYLKHEYPAIRPRSIRAVPDNVFTIEPTKPKGMSDLDWKIKKQVMSGSAHLPIFSNNISEIDIYFDSPIEAWPENCEDSWLLHWWRSQTFAFPTLSQTAHELLPIPSAEVD
jgi:hypothetical protein